VTGPLAGFPVVIEQTVDWADMDSFGHVNNVVYFRYFENARVEYIRRLGWWQSLKETGVGPIVASTHAKFRRPVAYPNTLLAGAKLVQMGTDRFTLRHALVSRTTGELVTDGEAVVVTFDYRAGTKVAVPEELRRLIEELESRPPLAT
jgi:acyl-CoA thioester hydrolase